MQCPKCGTAHESKFCPECGAPASTTCASCGTQHSAKFCPECGAPAAGGAPAQAAPAAAPQSAPRSHYEEVTLWEGKPAGLMDQLKEAGKLNDRVYTITNQRIIINHGLISKKQNEIELRHIKDINVKQSLTDRVAKVGDVYITSVDPTLGNFVLENVSDPLAVKELIRKALMDVRANMNILHHENM